MLIGVQDHFLFARMGGGRQPHRAGGFGTVQNAAELFQARLIFALKQAVIFQIAGEMQFVWCNSQALKPLKIRDRARGD